jgi:hypothetical protein
MARIRPATRIKAPRFGLAGTAALNQRDVHTRGSGTISPPVISLGGSGTRTPSGVVTGLLQFAEVPEIVFVRGFTGQSEHLGPWMIDPANRWTPGDIENASGWVPNRATTLTREDGLPLPNGVSYNSSTGVLSYNGADGTSPSESFTVRLAAGVSRSNAFRVRVLRPTAIWGTGALTDPFITSTFAGVPARDPANLGTSGFNKMQQDLLTTTRADSDPNVLLILGGTYEGYTEIVGTVNYGSIQYKAGLQHIYTLGDPRGRPVIKGNAVSSSFFSQSTRIAYWKHLDLWDFTIKEGSYTVSLEDVAPKSSYYCDLYMHDWTRETSGIGSDNRENDGDWVWDTNPVKSYFWKLDTVAVGGDGNTTHTLYIEGRPKSYMQQNVCRMKGGRRCSISKSTRYYKTMMNSRLSVYKDDGDVTVGSRSTELVDWVAGGEGVLYNNHLRAGSVPSTGPELYYGGTQYGVIRKRQRGDQWGCDEPAYPDVDYEAGITSFVGGGYAAPPGFDGTPATYKNPDYWAAVTAKSLSDPTNPYTFKYWVSYNIFEWVEEGYGRNAWFGDMGTEVATARQQFYPEFVRGTTPAGWVERSANFFINNTLIGWTLSDSDSPTDVTSRWLMLTFSAPVETNPDPTRVSVPGAFYDASLGYWVHGPGPYAYPPVTRRVDYNQGLVVPWDAQSAFAPLPDWFKIVGAA